METSPEVCWYALYTRPRHEKRVCEQLMEKQIEAFLPLQREIHRWKDRNKEVWLPLFTGYLFVHFRLQDRLKALQLPGAIRLVSANGRPTPIPDAELDSLRHALDSGIPLHKHGHLRVGRRVRVCRGALAGAEGILVRQKGGHRLILSIELIQRSVSVEVDATDVIPFAETTGKYAGAPPSAANPFGGMQLRIAR